MSLLDKLKAILGLGDSGSSTDEERDVGVTVERESGSGTEPDARTERAVKEPVDDDGDEAEPGGTGDGIETQDEPAEGDDEEDEDEEPRVPSEAVDVIKGIGPTYAGRLSDAGVETVDDLAAADAADLADRADVPQGRVENWIEKAKARSR